MRSRACARCSRAAGRDPRRATTYDLGFVAGPRLNAAGRLADMSVGIRCLLADTDVAALPLATELDRLNRERRDVEATMQDEALAELEARAAARRRGYRRCVHALPLPSRLASGRRRHRRVTAQGPLPPARHRVRAAAGGELKGSGRSIAGFHLRDALDLVAKRAPGLIRRFGGHAYAAGLTLAEADLPRFAALFEAIAREQLSPAQLARTLETDGAVGAGRA